MTFAPPPSTALDRLLREQASLLGSFSEAREAGITTDPGVRHLLRVRDRLQVHLATVDRHVYPLLRRLGDGLPRVARAVEKSESTEVAAQVQEFFDTQLEPNDAGFFTSWGAVYVAVQRRFRLERTVLFPALAASPLADSLAVPGPAVRLTTGPVAVTEIHKRQWRNTP